MSAVTAYKKLNECQIEVFAGVKSRIITSTEAKLLLYISGRHFVQDVYPNLSADDREFLISGTTPEEWDRICMITTSMGTEDISDEKIAGQPDIEHYTVQEDNEIVRLADSE